MRFLTAGESHGPALVGILEGLPAGLELSPADLQKELSRRKLGLGRSSRQGLETDRVEVLAGLRRGRTLGSPLAVRIPNRDHGDGREAPLTVPRPGHADLAGARKYGFTDLRDVMERASARETAARTALGAAAKRLLEECGVCVASRVVAIGLADDLTRLSCPVSRLNALADASPVRATDRAASLRMVRAVERAGRAGDTLGGIFEVWAEGLPAGLGSYAHWDRRLDGRLAGALMALNGIKGVDIGLGFAAAVPPGSKVLDAYTWKDGAPAYRSNRSGGIDGGMTTGEPLLLRAAMKPLPTLRKPLPSVDLKTGRAAPAPVLRSDVCAVPAAAVIAESLAALVLADALLEKTGGDSMREILPRLSALRK
ncbi:MAG: chorismate synthase [Elusimicrobia bacterium]|nr:chorismate synthase [Elusimicrobiota bacterium]